MQLLTAELSAQIPPLYSQEDTSLEDKMIYAKFFFPAGGWTWFVTEGEEEGGDYRMFGYVIGHESEWGYFSLNELESIKINGLTVERDPYFTPATFKEVIEDYK